VQRAYDHTAAGSPLRKAFVSGYCLDSEIPEDSRTVDGMPRDFLAVVAVHMYIFAQTFDIPRLRQDAIDRLLKCHNDEYDNSMSAGFIPASAIQSAYETHTDGK
jgi:hypothetical protein